MTCSTNIGFVERIDEVLPKAVAQAQSDGSADPRARFEAVMDAAERSGLLADKSTRIGSRISPALLDQAKRRTGTEDTDLIAFASVALDDDFAAVFEAVGGTVDPDLKFGF